MKLGTILFEVEWLPEAAPSTAFSFLMPEHLVRMELEFRNPQPYGMIAGSEGLGSEFFSNDAGFLVAMDLSLPFDVADVAPLTFLNPARQLIHTGVAPRTRKNAKF